MERDSQVYFDHVLRTVLFLPEYSPGVDVMNWERNINDADREGVIRQP